MKRKVAIVDLDNVVYPWTEVMAMLISANTETNQTPQELMKLYKSWNVWDDWGVPQGIFDQIWEKGIEQGPMWGVTEAFNAPPMPGAQTGLWKLSDNEWHIHLVTSRLVKFRLHDKAVRNTVDWLARNRIPYRSLTFTEDKSLIHGDVIIDDNPYNLIDHPAPIKLLYPAPHSLAWRETVEARNGGITILTDDQDLYPWDEIVDKLGDGRA